MEDTAKDDERRIVLSIEGKQQSITSSNSSISSGDDDDDGQVEMELEKDVNWSEKGLSIENASSLNNSLSSFESSILSGSLDDLSRSEIEKTESRQSLSKPDWTDKIIKLLIAKRRVLLMDQDQDQDGLISYEQSEGRIINLLSLLVGFSFIITLTLLLITFDKFKRHEVTNILFEPKLLFLEPKVSILDKSSGLLTTLDWENKTLKQDWQMQLPKSHLKDFFLYYCSRALNIIYGSYEHDMTYIGVGSGGKCHRVLPKSRFGYSLKPKGLYSYGGLKTVRVGNVIIFFGGYLLLGDPKFSDLFNNRDKKENRKVFLWHTQRHKWYKWYELPSGFGGRMCGIGVNDTTAVLFGMMQPISETWESFNAKVEDGYLKKITLNLWGEDWIQVDPHFHEFANLENEFFASQLDFDCATMFTKTADMKIIISINPSAYEFLYSQSSWEHLIYLLVIDWKTSTKSIIHIEKPNHFQRFDYARDILMQNGLFVTQGNLYHLVPIQLGSNDCTVAEFYLYKIDIETQTIQLQSKIQNYTLEGGLENFNRGFAVVPFIGPKSNFQDEYHVCDLLK